MKPKIRVKGCLDDWDNIPLGKLFRESNDRSSDGELLSVSLRYGVVKASLNGRFDNSSEDKSHYKVVNIGDIAYNTMRMWQGACGVSNFNGIVSPAYTVITPLSNLVQTFFIRLFKNKRTLKSFRVNSQGLTSDTWNLKYPLFREINVYYPISQSEQKLISTFFDVLDNKMEIVASRLASLKQVKEASLQAMFPQKGETVPKIRFKGFEGEWEDVKLSSFAKRIKRRNSCMESTLALTIASALGLVSQNDYFNNSVVGANIRNYYLLKRGEFAYNKSYSNGYPFGSVKRLDRYEQGILSTLYIVFTIDDSISSDYLTHFFDTTLWHKDVAERAAEGARNHGLLNISAEDFLDIAIWKPRSIEEQQQIASYFTSLDKQITLQTQRLEKLKQIKAACLDKMFV
nr:restriction endonuclease subunit S [uncultured Prevotella sp.]